MVAQGRVSAGEAPPQLQPQCGWQEAEAPPPLARCARGGCRGSARDCYSARGGPPAAPLLFLQGVCLGAGRRDCTWGSGDKAAKHMSVGY